MTVSLYDISIPVFTRGLTNLSAILDKAIAHAAAKKIDPVVFAQARLFPDMLPLTVQVQIACDIVKGGAARLSGIEGPKYEDNEATLADLKARVAKTLAFVNTVTAEPLQGSETRDIVLKTQSRTLNFKGLAYLTNFVLPNFYFHISMTYALLRHNGVELGKGDFLGAIQ
jgi:uncharacterized protein